MYGCAGRWRNWTRRPGGRFQLSGSKSVAEIPMHLMTPTMRAGSRAMSESKNIPIRTTVVGSYPIPDWLVSAPSQQALIDATKVVFKTQEMAGIDVVADGELYRFDINHPDTNGMIEYFTRPMSNIRRAVTRAVIDEFARQEGMGFRSEPAGVVEGAIDQ